MTLTDAITMLCDATSSEGRSPRTVDGYRSGLAHLVAYLGGDREVESITLADLRSYAAALRARTQRFTDHAHSPVKEGGLSPFSVANYLRSVKRLFNWLFDEGLLATNPAARLKNPMPTRRMPKAASMDDLAEILAATEGDRPAKLRDRALVLFLIDTGCRAGGICGLTLEDIDLAESTARVTEKGERTRFLPLSPVTVDALRAWLAVRPSGSPWVWVTLGPRTSRVRLDEEALGEVLRRLKQAAGVSGRANPHSFRHAFAREWLRNGGDLATLSAMLGHADPAVTARFYAVFTDFELGEFHAKYSPLQKLVKTD